MRGLLSMWCSFVLAGGPALASGDAEVCGAHGEKVAVQRVSDDGDLALASGRTMRIAGIRLPEEPRLRAASLAWLRARSAGPVFISQAYPPDRWARIPARLAAAAGTECLDFARGLLEAGLALIDPGAQRIVLRDLRAAEAGARQRGLGVWAEDRYKGLPVGHVHRLRGWLGRFVVVEGRVRSIGERRQRTYLNFGSDWASDFTIIIPRQTWNGMAARGVAAATLKGRRIRARGILEEWRGPALTVRVPEMIEALESGRERH